MKFKKKSFKLILILFSIILAEILIRTYAVISIDFKNILENPFLISMENIHPYRGFAHSDENVDTIFIKRKNTDDYNVVIIGGSTAIGCGASSDSTNITATLEKHLNNLNKAKKKRYKVYNCAHGSYHTTQTKSALSQLILNGSEIDLIVNIDGFNNIGRALENLPYNYPLNFPGIYWSIKWNIQENRTISYLGNFFIAARDDWTISKNSKLLFTVFNGLAYITYGKHYINNKVINYTKNYIKNIPREKKQEIIKQCIDFYSNDIIEMNAVASSFNIKTLFVLQPFIGHNRKQLSQSELNYIKSENFDLVKMPLEEWYSTYDKLVEMTKRLNTKNIKFYDSTFIFEDILEPVHIDLMHMNDYGQDIFGKKIAEYIILNF